MSLLIVNDNTVQVMFCKVMRVTDVVVFRAAAVVGLEIFQDGHVPILVTSQWRDPDSRLRLWVPLHKPPGHTSFEISVNGSVHMKMFTHGAELGGGKTGRMDLSEAFLKGGHPAVRPPPLGPRKHLLRFFQTI